MKIVDILKETPDGKYYINWEFVESIPEFAKLKTIEQSPEWHAEGNAWVHTKQVVKKAIEMAEGEKMLALDKKVLIISALFHDIGKINTTFTDKDDRIHSYGHEKESDKITRRLLWDENIAFREEICSCVRLHMECHNLKRMKQFNAFKKRVDYLTDNALKFRLLGYLHYCDIYGSNYESNLKRKDLDNADMLINYADDYLSLKDLYRYYHNQTSNIKVMIGLPGAGKTSMVEKYKKDNTVVLSRDLIRAELGFCQEGEKVVCTKEQEDQVTEVFEDRFINALDAKQDIIIDNINLKRCYRDSYKELAQGYNVYWEYIYVQAPSLEDNYRRRPMISKEVFDNMLNKFDYPEPSEYDRIITI